jgi:hypothetical protein
MLEAVTTDLVFTISLKRSTQNPQLSTSWPADYLISMQPEDAGCQTCYVSKFESYRRQRIASNRLQSAPRKWSAAIKISWGYMEVDQPFERPRWLRDVLRYLPLKPQFVLSGNVRDLHLMEIAPGSVVAQPLPVVLAASLRSTGYEHVIAYDPVQGFRPVLSPGEDMAPAVAVPSSGCRRQTMRLRGRNYLQRPLRPWSPVPVRRSRWSSISRRGCSSEMRHSRP